MAVKSLPLNGEGVLDDRSLIVAAHRSGLLTKNSDLSVGLSPDFDELRVSFRQLGRQRPHFTLSLLASVALLVRRVAESGRTARVVLPSGFRGRRSSLQWLLGHLEFDKLLTAQSWGGHVHVEGEIPEVRLDDNPETAHYLPFRWFDSSWFEGESVDDPYAVEPRVKPLVAANLRELLEAQGFVHSDLVDVFVHVMVLELGWNTVIHSSPHPFGGYGIVGAQIRDAVEPSFPDSGKAWKSLSLCVADHGFGIPKTLRTFYEGCGRNYEASLPCDLPTAIVRCSVDPDSTCRKGFPSSAYATGHRGLARVADAIRPSGTILPGVLSIRSGGGAIKLGWREPLIWPEPDERDPKAPIPGTTVEAELRLKAVAEGAKVRLRGKRGLALSDVTYVLGFDGRGGGLVLRSPEQVIPELRRRVLLVDVGHADEDVRDLEVLAKAAAKKCHGCLVIFWNVRSTQSRLQPLAEWVERATKETSCSFAFVRNPLEAILLPARQADDKRDSLDLVGRLLGSDLATNGDEKVSDGVSSLILPIDTYLQLDRRVNSEHLREGFRTQLPDSGFFVGRIHLLSGGQVDNYFSVARAVSDHTRARRWVSTCGAGILGVRSETEAEARAEDIVVLGLAPSMRDVLVRAWSECRIDLPAHVVMSYDVPTKNELAVAIGKRRSVILVTDVVSSGSLLRETARTITALGKNLLGVVALVDAREHKKEDFGTKWFVAGGDLTTNGPGVQGDLLAGEYWVDPVSLVPGKRTVFGEGPDRRVEGTIQAIAGAGALRMGHIVDGQRHMSAYVDVGKLLDRKGDWIVERIREERDIQLKGHSWNDYSPSVALHPSGIGRIEPVFEPPSDQRQVTAYQTAAKQYVALLRRHLWATPEVVEVPRVFDPGGRPRCARTLEGPEGQLTVGGDVLIADDCLWTGRATEQLVQLAVSAGAKRILVVPLLARVNQSQLTHWEGWKAVKSADGSVCEILYLIPLVLPIGFYVAGECPFEQTGERLARWTGYSGVLQEEETKARARLRPLSPREGQVVPESVAALWLRLRALAELASDDETALEELLAALKSLDNDTTRTIAVKLFLAEWPLLGRARLRQTVRPVLETAAKTILFSEKALSDQRVAASSLLRSLYPEGFVRQLPKISELARSDVDLFGRVVLQMSTLPETEFAASETLAFLHKVVSDAWFASVKGDDATTATFGRLVGVCQQLLWAANPIPLKTSSPRGAAAQLLELFESDFALRHLARAVVELFAGQGDGLSAFTADTLRSFAADWQQQCETVFREKLLPLAAALEPLLLLSLSRSGDVALPESRYFRDLRSPYGRLVSDLAGFGSSLRTLAQNPSSSSFKSLLVEIAIRLRDNVLGTSRQESVLLSGVKALRGPTVEEVLGDLETKLRTTVQTTPSLTVGVEGRERVDLNSRVFCTEEVVKAACTGIVDNVRRYAFQDSKTDSPTVMIVLEAEDAKDPRTLLKVLNNGTEITEPVRPSLASVKAAEMVARFGGELSQPRATRDRGCRVRQDLAMCLW